MNVLMVDDQKPVVEQMKAGINWESLGVNQVFTACCAMEAKLVLVNFSIDLLITDIEMPEEDGLSLCRWAKEKDAKLECIFLTSHAEFEYAQKAINLGGFDYILQPARYSDMEKVIARAFERIKSKRQIQKYEKAGQVVMKQRDLLLESLIRALMENEYASAEKIHTQLQAILHMDYEECQYFPFVLQIDNRQQGHWGEKEVIFSIRNIAEELLISMNCRACITYQNEWGYRVLLVMEKRLFSEEICRQAMRDFMKFITEQLKWRAVIYAGRGCEEKLNPVLCRELTRAISPTMETSGKVFWDHEKEARIIENGDEDVIRVMKAIEYIQKNISKNIARSELAEVVYLNEDYFTRIFKKQTGYTYKEYVLLEKMRKAEMLLEQTKFPISVIASKVGYDNCSHFTKMFKKITGTTPKDFRKTYQEEN